MGSKKEKKEKKSKKDDEGSKKQEVPKVAFLAPIAKPLADEKLSKKVRTHSLLDFLYLNYILFFLHISSFAAVAHLLKI